jgi:hypothetical protein
VTASDASGVGEWVELSFPARGDLTVLARLVASALSARVGFDIEELEDLRMAVGELCLLTIPGGEGTAGNLRVQFSASSDGITVICTLVGAAPPIVRDPEGADAVLLSEQILAALVDSYGLVEEGDGQVRSWLCKHRRVNVGE